MIDTIFLISNLVSLIISCVLSTLEYNFIISCIMGSFFGILTYNFLMNTIFNESSKDKRIIIIMICASSFLGYSLGLIN